VRKHPVYQLEGFISTLYPKMRSYLDPKIGANLRFQEEKERRARRRPIVTMNDPLSGVRP
jgi:hypothetical protein